jgi:hypothetical protein
VQPHKHVLVDQFPTIVAVVVYGALLNLRLACEWLEEVPHQPPVHKQLRS